MRGNGKDVDDGAGSSLGSTSGGASGRNFRHAGEEPSEALYLSMLARSGLNMLAGNGDRIWRNTQPGSLALRLGTGKGEENVGGPSFQAGVGGRQLPLSADVVRRLTMDECWRLIIARGMRWPAWNETTALQTTLGVKNGSDDSTFAVSDGGQPASQRREQDILTMLAARALEALAAQAPLGRVPRAGMQAPKPTTQATHERLGVKVARGDALEAPRIPQQPTSSTKAPTSSQEMPAPKPISARSQNAELTIFYDGIVNVCGNVPPDKARLIMMYAEKAGLAAQAGTQFAPPSPAALPQASRASDAGPSQKKGLQPDSKPTEVAFTVGLSSAARGDVARDDVARGDVARDDVARGDVAGGDVSQGDVAWGDGARSDGARVDVARADVARGDRARVDVARSDVAQVAHGKSPLPLKVTVTTQPSNPPQQLRQNVMLKPLPNARRNSLARFLDSRKRWMGPSLEEGSPKKLAIGEAGPSDADDLKGSEKPSAVDQAASDPVTVDRALADQTDMR